MVWALLPLSACGSISVCRTGSRRDQSFLEPLGHDTLGDGSILYVADASENSLLSVDTATGRWKRVVRFAQNPNPTPVGPPVDVASRTSTPFLTGLTTVTDVLVRQTGGDRPTFFALEFSQNMSTTPAAPGRLLRYDTCRAAGGLQ